MPGALFVANEDVSNRALEQRVVGRKDATSGKTEDDLGIAHFEALNEGLGAGQLHGGRVSLR
jgi:hypothetical protein